MQDKIIFFDIDYTLFDTDAFKKSDLQTYKVYDEVYAVLEQLTRIARLGIFSQGEVEFQKNKLSQTNVIKYFDPEDIHIFPEKQENLVSILKQYKDNAIYMVDDKVDILEFSHSILSNIYTIWIKREIYSESDKKPFFVPNAIILNLTEVLPLIQ